MQFNLLGTILKSHKLTLHPYILIYYRGIIYKKHLLYNTDVTEGIRQGKRTLGVIHRAQICTCISKPLNYS